MCTSDTATAARFEIDRIESVHISGVTFQGCTNGAIQMSTVTRATIKKCNFTQNSRMIVQASHSVITVDKSNFYNNSLGYNYGSAIYASHSKI